MPCPACRRDPGHAPLCPAAPCCRWCGADVAEPDALCAECQEREADRLERRRAARELAETERRAAA